MDNTLKRRLISAFGQWAGFVELVNEKAKVSHAEDQETLGVVAQPEQWEAATRAWNNRKDPILHALRRYLRGHYAWLAWHSVVSLTIFDAHFVTLALEHCSNTLRHLREGLDPTTEAEAIASIDEYLRLWRDVRDVRNAFEHEEEYLAGEGQKPALPNPDWDGGARVGRSQHMTYNENGLQTVDALGRTYHLGLVIDACLHRVTPHLRDIMTPLCREPNA